MRSTKMLRVLAAAVLSVAVVSLPATPSFADSVTGTIATAGFPTIVAVSPDGAKAYVTSTMANGVIVLDTTNDSIVTNIGVGNVPSGVAFSPTQNKAYVANMFSNTVSVINSTTNSVSTSVSVGTGPELLAITPDGSEVYVPNYFDDTVSVIDTSNDSVAATISVGVGPAAVAFSADGSKAYVTQWGGDTVTVIDTVTRAVFGSPIMVGATPGGIKLSPDGSKAYVANWNAGTISVISTSTDSVVETIPVGSHPHSVAFSPDGVKAYVTNAGDQTTPGMVLVIDVTNDVVVGEPIQVGVNPLGVAFLPDGRAYVANQAQMNAGSVSILAPSTVTFDANGGSGQMSAQTAELPMSALNDNAFSRAGFAFAGWNTEADGSGTSFANGATYPFDGDATLYAQWSSTTLAATGTQTNVTVSAVLSLILLGGSLLLMQRNRWRGVLARSSVHKS